MRRTRNDAGRGMKARRECAGGENILELAGDAEDLLSVVLCMKKLKGETKHRQTCNSQQRDDRVKAYTAWHRGSCYECSVLRWWGLGWGTDW